MIKHFTWSYNGEQGRVAVRIEEETIEFRQIAGNAPPAALNAWANAINNAFDAPAGAQSLLVYAHNLHAERQNRFVVIERLGMSGALDLLLIEERSAGLADYPTRARLHISMAGKFNQGFEMWLGDFSALRDYALESDYPLFDLDAHDLSIEEAPTREGLTFSRPPLRWEELYSAE